MIRGHCHDCKAKIRVLHRCVLQPCVGVEVRCRRCTIVHCVIDHPELKPRPRKVGPKYGPKRPRGRPPKY